VDRPLDPSVERSRRWRRLSFVLGGITIAAAALLWLPALVTPTLSRSKIRTAIVDAGPIESVITASGAVVPEVEQVITSPVDARVVRIFRTAGAQLHKGDPLLALDVSQAQLDVESLAQDRAIKENEQAQKRLALEKSLIDLDGKVEVETLQLQALRQQFARDQALSRDGLLSTELLRKSELAVTQAEIELKQLQAARENARVAHRAEVQGLDLEMAKIRSKEAQARRTLDLASPRADRDGVLTWSLTQEGVAVHKGDVVARLADLRSFRVDATVSDVHARRLRAGLPVIVRLGDDTLDGAVSNVLPTIENGVISLQVALAERSDARLRANLRVDVFIVTDRKPRAVRVKRGPFATGEGTQPVFVVRGGRAVRTPVEFGLTGFDQFEARRGLSPGDEVIISDMSDYARLREVRIR
jgi:HlyD family secretion protein